MIAEWQALRQFKRRSREERALVFYSEGAAYWPHFQQVIDHLTQVDGRTVCYVSSSSNDPGLGQDNPRILGFHIGAGVVRTLFFSTLDCGVLAMTMPDLQSFHIRRSKMPVHYAYIFHSMVSTHMIYRTHAFDHYDSILCCGPHHMTELRETEALYGLPARSLHEHGYGRLDAMLAARPEARTPSDPLEILIAPSWGPGGVFESGVGQELVGVLLEAGMRVTVRPHPQTLILAKQSWTSLVDRYSDHPRFVPEVDVGSQASLQAADFMVSDWSGAALEFAFAFERPVLFIDVPRKVNNPEYTRLHTEPIEVSLRQQLGEILSLESIADAPRIISALCTNSGEIAERARTNREKWIFNTGSSGRRGAEILAGIEPSSLDVS